MTQDQVLTLKEVAALLKIAERTAYSMMQAGELPGFKVGGQWRFKRADIEAWIEKQKEDAGTQPARGGVGRGRRKRARGTE